MAGTPDTGEGYLLQRDSAAGKRQGRYVLGELLGPGDMAEVFAGQSMGSHGFQKPVAIKRLLPELANDTVFVERLIGEAKLLVGMQHGNIVSVLDLARDGNDVFLVMEFMDGPSLRQLLKARGTRGLPIGVSTYIVQNAATGLEFAHGRPGGAVIHADISPSNILLTTSGEVRVADFGIARREGGGAGIVEGKWAYMAPEQARGESLTPRSDVFALGVVLYELITGQHPLGRQVTADERESAPLHVVPPRQVKASIPVGIDALVMKALAHDPRERFAKMQQFIDALVEERFANGWREGANDLAGVIRKVTPGAGGTHAGPRTMHTDRPVTIVTRSLISQPHRPPSQPPVIVEHQVPPPAPPPPPPNEFVAQILDSGAQTKMIALDQIVPTVPPAMPTAAPPMQVMPQMQPQPQQLMALAASMLPAPELASVHGGNTFTGSSATIDVGDKSSRWAFGVLGVAALAGAIAAVAFGSKHTEDIIEVPPPPVVAVQAPPPVVEQPPTPPIKPEIKPEIKPDIKTDVAPPPAPAASGSAATTTPPPANSSFAEKVAAARRTGKQPAPAGTAKTPSSSHGNSQSFLQVDEWNGEYASITIAGQSHDTPGAKFYLPAGTYTMQVHNDTEQFKCKETVEAGKSRHVHVSLENQQCSD
ncbi:MAG: serine/threonine-protein kinase [Kofleriaceae bacterium]